MNPNESVVSQRDPDHLKFTGSNIEMNKAYINIITEFVRKAKTLDDLDSVISNKTAGYELSRDSIN